MCVLLQSLGFPEPDHFPAPDPEVVEGSRPNVVYRLHGGSAGPTRWFIAHLDVVPAGGGWSGDAFTLTVEEDRVIGRGTLDNQQGIVSMVLAFWALMNSGEPHFPLGLVFVSDEETGSTHGLHHLLERHAIFAPDDLVVVPDAGNPQSTMIEVAEKSVLWLQVETSGRQCHASHPAAGKNALLAAARLMVKIDSLHEKYPQRQSLFDPPFSTFEVTKKPSNQIENVNTIPGRDLFFVDCRILPGISPQEVVAAIEALAGEVEREMNALGRYGEMPLAITVSVVSLEPAAPVTSPTAPVVRALQSAIRDVYGVAGQPMGMGGATVAALLRRKGFPTAVWATMDEVAHQADEYSKISFTLGDAKVFAHLCLNSIPST